LVKEEEENMRKFQWSIAMTSAFVLVLAGTAVAKPPSPDPPVPPVVTIESLDMACDGAHLNAELTASAGEQTRLTDVHLVIHEIRLVTAGTGGYFPYDTMLEVAQWSDGVGAGEGPGKPSPGLANPMVFSLSTVDGSGHHWNTVLGDGTPAIGSWFEVHAGAHGESTERDGGWAGADRTDFINCGTGELMPEAAFPWEDWNYPEEG
jgi:hypothetical protein